MFTQKSRYSLLPMISKNLLQGLGSNHSSKPAVLKDEYGRRLYHFEQHVHVLDGSRRCHSEKQGIMEIAVKILEEHTSTENGSCEGSAPLAR